MRPQLYEQGSKREAADLASQPSAQWKQAADGGGRLGEYRKPSTSMGRASNGKPPTSPLNPALTVIAIMGRVMGAYAEFPARLAQCRSPMDIWSEQARSVQRVFSASPVSADRPLRA